MDHKELLDKAIIVRKNAYAPYSGFKVGAAVLTKNGKVYTGVNIENISYGATNCAERTAIFKAVSEGDREIKAIAIAADGDNIVYPCGICRQVIAEFADSNTAIICGNENGDYRIYTINGLLPEAFKSF